MAVSDALQAHLETGATTLCRCWAVTRLDGVVMGFTDHDRPVAFDGITFVAESGMTGRATVQTTGLAIDNTEAAGALSSAAITEADLAAGRFDGAGIRMWLVNWAEPGERALRFRGTLGEIEWSGGGFRAELRGLTEALNQPQGRVYQAPCAAVLGDAACGVDLDAPGLRAEWAVETVTEARVFEFADPGPFEAGWFAAGRLRVTSGAAAGLVGIVKTDRIEAGVRRIALWQSLRAEVAAGDGLRIEAGCDKRAETCRGKFRNFNNFRGFPHIPGEDWLMSYPSGRGVHDGGSMNR